MSTRIWLCVVAAAVLMTGAAFAQPMNDEAAAPGAANVPRVRASDRLAAELLQQAAAASPTVAGLIAQLDQSDLIVNVVTGPLSESINGHTRIAAATPSVRYLRVTLRIPGATPRLIATLGHELRHAVEIAAMPDVRNEASLAAAYRKVGTAMSGDGFFETDAAVEGGPSSRAGSGRKALSSGRRIGVPGPRAVHSSRHARKARRARALRA